MNILLIALFVVLLMAVVVFRIRQIKSLEQENRLMQSYLLSMEAFYSAIQARIEATRNYRHDLAKHIQNLEYLLQKQENDAESDPKSEKTAEIHEYMENLRDKYNVLKKEKAYADEIVGSIISLKEQQCRSKGIPITIQVENVMYDGIQEVDMVGLLYNLLDNAIEANERIPRGGKQGISLSMGKTETEIRIEIKNSIPAGEKVVFKTQKAMKEEHGIGTKIIDGLIGKYNGRKEIMIDEEQHVFGKTVYLCL